jgi:anti-anti-sigma factor
VHGMAPGDVVPTTEVLLRHAHPEDRERVSEALAACAADGSPFGLQYRLLDLDGHERLVTITGAAAPADESSAAAVAGFLVDVSAAHRALVARAVNTQLARALESHAVIDQAKGALMLAYGIDGDAAFELLRWSSQQRNVRLLVLAERLVRAVEQAGGLAPALRHRLDELFFATLEEREEPVGPRTTRPQTFRAATSVRAGVPVVRVEGAVDLASAGELTAALARAGVSARRAGALVVDLRGVEHLGSVGVSVLIAAQRRQQSVGVQMRIVVGPDASLSLAGTHGLDVVMVASDHDLDLPPVPGAVAG